MCKEIPTCTSKSRKYTIELKNKQLFVVKDSNPETFLLSEMKYGTPNKSKIDQNYKKKMINNVIT